MCACVHAYITAHSYQTSASQRRRWFLGLFSLFGLGVTSVLSKCLHFILGLFGVGFKGGLRGAKSLEGLSSYEFAVRRGNIWGWVAGDATQRRSAHRRI